MNLFGDTYEVDYEIYVGEQLVQKQKMKAPQEILMINFMQAAQQVSGDGKPIKIKMLRQETIWDSFEKKEKVLNNEIEFSNNVMVAWEKDKQYGGNND